MSDFGPLCCTEFKLYMHLQIKLSKEKRFKLITKFFSHPNINLIFVLIKTRIKKQQYKSCPPSFPCENAKKTCIRYISKDMVHKPLRVFFVCQWVFFLPLPCPFRMQSRLVCSLVRATTLMDFKALCHTSRPRVPIMHTEAVVSKAKEIMCIV